MKFQPIAEKLFGAGIILTAVLLPLEIVPNRLISMMSLLITLLLLPYPIALLANRKNLKGVLRSKLWLAFALPAAAASLSVFGIHHAHINIAPLRTLLVLLLRGWLIAQFAEKKHLKLFVKTTWVVAAAVVLFGLYQYFGDLLGLPHRLTFLRDNYSSSGTHPFPRVHSTAREPLLLAAYLLIPLGLLIPTLLKKGADKLWAGALAIGILILFFTLNARSGLFALFAMAIVVAISQRHRTGLIMRGLALTALSFGLALGMLTALKGGGVVIEFVRHGSGFSDASFQNRAKVWQAFPHIFESHPLLGVGLGNSSWAILGPTCSKLPADPPVFNNTYLTVAAETGTIGILALIPLLWLMIRGLWRGIQDKLSTVAAGLGLAVVGYAVQITSYEGFLNLRVWALVGLFLAAYRLYYRRDLGLSHG